MKREVLRRAEGINDNNSDRMRCSINLHKVSTFGSKLFDKIQTLKSFREALYDAIA